MDQWSDNTLKAWFYVLLGAALLSGVWLNIEPHACPVPEALLSGEKPPQPACFEFWLNRYQTLLTGMFAAIAAGAALLQLSAARQQGSAAVQQNSLANLEYLSKQIANISEMKFLYEKLQRSLRDLVDAAIDTDFGDGCDAAHAALEGDYTKLEAAVSAHFWSDRKINFVENRKYIGIVNTANRALWNAKESHREDSIKSQDNRDYRLVIAKDLATSVANFQSFSFFEILRAEKTYFENIIYDTYRRIGLDLRA